MRVSLLTPPAGNALGLQMITLAEPLGLECVAAAIEQEGHRCQLVDLRIDDLPEGLAKVRSFAPHIIGVQCNFTSERSRAQALVAKLGLEFPGTLVVVGGHDASRDPEWFLQPGVGAVALGDGEQIAPALVRAWEESQDLTAVPGLAVNTSDGPIYTPAPARADIDELPTPARHLVSDYAHKYYMNYLRPMALLEVARGCPFQCSFCSVWKFHAGTYRAKSTQRVVRELQEIDAPYVFITDDIFWLNRSQGEELARAITAAGIRKHFFVQTRTDVVARSPELVNMWKSCGRLTVFLGLERIDDDGLKSINKKNTAAENDRAIQILKDLDVAYTASFIIDPQWDRDDFARLRDWIERTGSYNSGFSILTPLPGTDLWEDVEDQITTRDWELFDLEHAVLPTKLPLGQFYEEYAGLWAHTLQVRYKNRGFVRSYFRTLAALATGRATIQAWRRGVLIGRALSRPANFLAAHAGSRVSER